MRELPILLATFVNIQLVSYWFSGDGTDVFWNQGRKLIVNYFAIGRYFAIQWAKTWLKSGNSSASALGLHTVAVKTKFPAYIKYKLI